MANWFQKMFIGSVLAGSLSVPPVQAENVAQDAKTNLTEAPAPDKKNHSEIRVFKKVNVIDMETPLPGSWMGGGHNQEEKASYDHAHKRIVCQTYFISDEVAYAHTPTTAPRMPRADFKTALNEFNQMLKAVKYKGSLPETLEDVQNVLASAGKNLGKKDAQNVSRTASSTGLEAAICFKRSIENINNENTSRHIIVHEMEHGETAKIGEKAFLPETLLSPQDYLLFNMADELNSHFKEGALAGKSQQKVVDEFRSIKEACYLERYSGDIARNNSFWHSETYRHAYAQNLDLKSSQQIVDSKPIVFDAETFSVTVDNIQYPVSKCVDETNQTWCYTVMEGDGRRQLPEGTVVTTPGGKKFAANVLYDQNGKQVKDKDGNTVGAVGYFNENDGWSIRLSGSRQTAEDNFSSANLEKLMTEKFGEKSAGNQYRALIEAELERYRQTDFYRNLSGVCAAESLFPEYVAECKASPLTDDFVRTGSQYRAEQNDNTDGLVDITADYARQGIINNHFDYIRTALSEKDGNREAKETKNLTADRGNAADVSVYDLLSRQRE